MSWKKVKLGELIEKYSLKAKDIGDFANLIFLALVMIKDLFYRNMLLKVKIQIAIERFFRTLKYENIYITEYRDVKELKEGLKKYIEFYNCKRLHQALKYKTPTEIYNNLI
ncbi:MAG: transposase [Desulfobacterales bacterium]|nr:transposase [Desulfobacterales bacterium]MBF0396958.1 transposase [Desulfobacterales bacterium]